MTKKEWRKLDKLIEQESKQDKNWTCEICGRSKEQGYQIHHHHFIARTCTPLRWVLHNIFVVCFRCHKLFEEDPQWAVKTYKDLRGDKYYNLLTKLKHKTNKKTFEENKALMTAPLEEILKSYKETKTD